MVSTYRGYNRAANTTKRHSNTCTPWCVCCGSARSCIKQEAAQGLNEEENGNNQAFGIIAPRVNVFRTPISVLKVATNLHQWANQDTNKEEAGNGHRMQSQSQTIVTPGQGEDTLEGLFEVAKVDSQSENEN